QRSKKPALESALECWLYRLPFHCRSATAKGDSRRLRYARGGAGHCLRVLSWSGWRTRPPQFRSAPALCGTSAKERRSQHCAAGAPFLEAIFRNLRFMSQRSFYPRSGKLAPEWFELSPGRSIGNQDASAQLAKVTGDSPRFLLERRHDPCFRTRIQ